VPDLATLKARIATDLRRVDLGADIGYAIADAVAQYQPRRFAFNQTRDNFDTIAGVDFYGARSAGETYITQPNMIPGDVAEIDAVTLTYAGSRWTLDPWSFERGEESAASTTTQGQPRAWSWFGQQLRLYPTPDTAYVMTLSYLRRIPAPTADGDDNAWTTDAEQLIRACAKKILFRDVLRAPMSAAAAEAAEREVLARLRRAARQLSTGSIAGSGM
jgi:hypothetical protein